MRTLLVTTLACLSLSLAACGGDDDGGDGVGTPIDAAPGGVDAPGATPMVSMVDCAGVTPAATVTAPSFMYSPSAVTISTGQVVKFMMPATHDAKSRVPGLFHIMFNQEGCVKFDSPGSFEFFCVPHLFTGTITVQ